MYKIILSTYIYCIYTPLYKKEWKSQGQKITKTFP